MIIDALGPLLSSPAVPANECPDVRAWWPRWRALASSTPRPFERAVLGGVEADRLAWAFASGYQAALRALDPSLPDDAIAALCVTEEGGNSPRAIRTTLTPHHEGFSLDGEKRWATLGPEGGLFLVIAREAGSGDERASLKAVKINAGTRGLCITTMTSTAFVPEVPHARIKLDGIEVPASAVMEGDAYVRYVKPFRTIEDIHVQAACIAYLVAEARRRDWPQAWLAQAILVLHQLEVLAGLDPLASETHVALGAALERSEKLIGEADRLWATQPNHAAAGRWIRDRPLFSIAAKARAQRLAAARARLDAKA
jgi:alkylation response protein AidB-like acyl-CoA dehydrogenase